MRTKLIFLVAITVAPNVVGRAENWPRWRGPGGNAVSGEVGLPSRWDNVSNVRWKTKIPGEGTSSPIVWGHRVLITSALDRGLRRLVHCLDRRTGRLLWSREIADDRPELTSPLTGHAAATPVTDGRSVVACFGNAGLVCYDLSGELRWRRLLGEFDSELGLASSPILFRDLLIQVCDHDGSRFRTFDSYLTAIELDSGKVRWKTTRPRLFRSWSTPVVAPNKQGLPELVVNAQDQLRCYHPGTGELLWQVAGMTGWVTPSPVWGHDLVFAASGRSGPIVAVRLGGRGNVTESHVAWRVNSGAPYVCSPLLYQGYLFVQDEQGVLVCYDAKTGQRMYQQRLPGKFTSSPIAGDGKILLTNELGTTFVLQAGAAFRVLAQNRLAEECLASAAVSQQNLFIRTSEHLYCIGASR